MSPGQRARAAGPPRILFATSNGTGLGHLNRAMAIARRMPPGHEFSFFTLSGAAPVVAHNGYDVDYLSSYRRPASGTDRAWDLRLKAMLSQVFAERRPDLVVFDGVHPYRALTHLLSARDAPQAVWCRRPMWRPQTPSRGPMAALGSLGALGALGSLGPLGRVGAFDAVLEPGELAEAADVGPTVARRGEAKRIRPIVYLDDHELPARAEAAAALGLDPSRRTALVNLGQGGDVDRAVAGSLRILTAVPGLQVAALQSSIAPELEIPAGVVRLDSTFPMSRYFRAFDVAVAAAGYNAFHELIAFAVPTLFVPMPRNTDDQAARARWAAESGVGLAVEGAADPALADELHRLADPAVAGALAARCAEVFPGNGAGDAAAMLSGMLAGRRVAPTVRDRGRFNRWLRLSSHAVGPSLPLVAAAGARDLLRQPERRAPRLAILAMGVADEEVAGRVVEAMGSVPPERVLVLTDSLAFADLRAIGVGFELLPPWPAGVVQGRQVEDLRARVRLLLERRRPIRAVSIGAHGTELLGLGGDSTGFSER